MESKSNWTDDKLEKIIRWLAIAIEDRDSAYLVFEGGRLRNTVYNLQQSAEKLLKAFLVANDAEVEKTHNIDSLLLAGVEFDIGLARFKKFGIGTTRMTAFATEYRYPNQDKKDFLDLVEVIDAAEFTDALYAYLKPFFGEEIWEKSLHHAGLKDNPFERNSMQAVAMHDENRHKRYTSKGG